MRGRGAAGWGTAGLVGSAPGTSGNTFSGLGTAGFFAGRALRFGASGFRPGRGAAFHRDGACLGGFGFFFPPYALLTASTASFHAGFCFACFLGPPPRAKASFRRRSSICGLSAAGAMAQLGCEATFRVRGAARAVVRARQDAWR